MQEITLVKDENTGVFDIDWESLKALGPDFLPLEFEEPKRPESWYIGYIGTPWIKEDYRMKYCV